MADDISEITTFLKINDNRLFRNKIVIDLNRNFIGTQQIKLKKNLTLDFWIIIKNGQNKMKNKKITSNDTVKTVWKSNWKIVEKKGKMATL